MKIRDLFRFGHTAIFGFTAVLPLIGAGTAAGGVTGWQVGALLATAVSYHIFAYLLNDIIDLPLDRSQPSRADYPLVCGLVTVRRMWLWVLAQLPILLILWWVLGGNGRSLFWLSWAVVGMTIYNLWGKRSPLPPLTDLVQGSSWAALLLFGATVVGVPIGQTWLAAGFIVVYILLVNGINGSLRDLANDYVFGARTTAIWLGARPFPSDHLTIPDRFLVYTLFLQVTLSGVSFLLMLDAGSVLTELMFWGVIWLNLLCWLLAVKIAWPRILTQKVRSLLMGHNILMLLLLFTAVLPQIDPPLRWLILLAFALPLLTADWLVDQEWHSSGSLNKT